jgi:hypothetical protein
VGSAFVGVGPGAAGRLERGRSFDYGGLAVGALTSFSSLAAVDTTLRSLLPQRPILACHNGSRHAATCASVE